MFRTPGVIRGQLYNVTNQNLYKQTKAQANKLNQHAIDYSFQQLTYFPLKNIPNNVTKINFKNNNLIQLPPKFQYNFQQLQQLDLSQNCISKLAIPSYQSLKYLLIDQNRLVSLQLKKWTSLVHLSCQNNNIEQITLPASLKIANLNANNIQNCLFIKKLGKQPNCLQQLSIKANRLIQLNLHSDYENISLPKLKLLVLDSNKIIYLSGMQTIPNLQELYLANNKISLGRSIINQILKLNKLTQIVLDFNPLQQGGYDRHNIKSMFLSKFAYLKSFSCQEELPIHQSICDEVESVYGNDDEIDIKQSPFKLFISSQPQHQKKRQWNFTLGQCSDEEPQYDVDQEKSYKPEIKELQGQQLVIIHKKMDKIQYIKYLNQLYAYSFIPPRPVKIKQANQFISVRLDAHEQQFKIISQIMKNRGSIVYLRKLVLWNASNMGIPTKHEQLLFVQQQYTKQQFSQMIQGKFNKQFKRSLMGKQPNLFSCYHLLARWNSQLYQVGCVYLIQTEHL